MNGIKEKNRYLLEQASKGDREAEAELIKENMGLVKSIAIRFIGRGQELEDLIQIGAMGLLKAVRGYDASFNTAFSTYAVPMVMGEIKRFLRDDGLIKVSREAKRNFRILMKCKEEFARDNGCEPKIDELCLISGMSQEDALYAIEACSGTVSLNEKIGGDDGMSVEDICEDEKIGDVTEKIALMQAIETLNDTDKKIITMRYFKGMTQNEVAKVMGMTQVKVSRSEKRIILLLKDGLKCG